MSSFLEKYKRQPKIYVDFPSKGLYYNGDIVQDQQYTEIPVFGMNTMDEIMLKTPDALFSFRVKSQALSIMESDKNEFFRP